MLIAGDNPSGEYIRATELLFEDLKNKDLRCDSVSQALRTNCAPNVVAALRLIRYGLGGRGEDPVSQSVQHRLAGRLIQLARDWDLYSKYAEGGLQRVAA